MASHSSATVREETPHVTETTKTTTISDALLHALMLAYGGFEGNAQTLRLLTETIYSDWRSKWTSTYPQHVWCERLSG